MFQEVTKVLATQLEDKCYIDCFGGFARSISYKDKDGRICSYPISCDKLDECKPGKPYTEMLPNDKYKSVAWFEGVQRARRVTNTSVRLPKQSLKTFELDLKLVLWYNINKLGYQNCSIADHIISDLMMCLCINGSAGDFTTFKSDIVSFTTNDATAAFGKYSYKDIADAFGLPPYEFITMTVRVRFSISSKCQLLKPFECKEPIDCTVK